MPQHQEYTAIRILAMGIAAASGAAMFYVGLYQSRAIHRLWCPLFGKGCEAVADAPFARPFGIPDGYIATAIYGAILLLLVCPVEKVWIWVPLMALAALATLANFLGVRDMVQLGGFCFYCTLTTILSPGLLWAIWKLR
jgi:uncharacterized membrane protein